MRAFLIKSGLPHDLTMLPTFSDYTDEAPSDFYLAGKRES